MDSPTVRMSTNLNILKVMQESQVDHLVVKHILKYVAGTCDWDLFYPGGGSEDPILIG
jgi:hypothetical protein